MCYMSHVLGTRFFCILNSWLVLGVLCNAYMESIHIKNLANNLGIYYLLSMLDCLDTTMVTYTFHKTLEITTKDDFWNQIDLLTTMATSY